MSTTITDPEVKVMQQICETLDALTPEARGRVLASVAGRLGIEHAETPRLLLARRAGDRAQEAASDAIELAEAGRFTEALDTFGEAMRHMGTLFKRIQEAQERQR